MRLFVVSSSALGHRPTACQTQGAAWAKAGDLGQEMSPEVPARRKRATDELSTRMEW